MYPFGIFSIDLYRYTFNSWEDGYAKDRQSTGTCPGLLQTLYTVHERLQPAKASRRERYCWIWAACRRLRALLPNHKKPTASLYSSLDYASTCINVQTDQKQRTRNRVARLCCDSGWAVMDMDDPCRPRFVSTTSFPLPASPPFLITTMWAYMPLLIIDIRYANVMFQSALRVETGER